jgi:SPP1 gp7 family putative phage head morphogenesis protein
VGDDLLKELDKQTSKVARMIYQGTLPEDFVIDETMTRQIALKLRDAILEGFGKAGSNIDYNTPDGAVIRNLEESVYSFSAAKNYNQLRDMTSALLNDDMVVRSFREFKEICNNISYQYNSSWLLSEYNTAIASAQTSARWNEYQESAQEMPYLQYVTAGDDRVREEHAELDGIIRRIDDEFWDTYYPPNGYNCRCDVIQLPGEATEADIEKYTLPVLDPIFATNLAKTGVIFPTDHPYYTDLPAEVAAKAKELFNKDSE